MRTRRRSPSATLAFALLWSGAALPGQQPAEFETRIAELEGVLAAESARLDASERAWAAEIEKLETERRELAARVLSTALRIETLEQEGERLAAAGQELAVRSEALSGLAARTIASGRTVAEQLSILLDETPVADGSGEAVRTILDRLGAASDAASALATLAELPSRIDAVHERAGRVAVERGRLRTASGRVEEIDLLAAGAVAFAYRTVADRRVGIAVSSPADASGFRWTEDIEPWVVERVGESIDGLRRGETRQVLVPMDPSGRLKKESLDSEAGAIEFLGSGGPVMLFIALVAVLALGLVLERLWVLSRARGSGPHCVESVLEACRSGRFDEARTLAASAQGVLPRTLLACLTAREAGTGAMEDRIQEQLLHETPRLERFLGGIAVLGAVAPLLGLLGTVTGMIKLFGVITAYRTTDASLMAGGISEALVTTAAGLAVAIPIVLMHGVLSGRVEQVLGETEKHAATLLNTLSSAAQRE